MHSSNAYFGPGSGEIFLAGVYCSGHESSILDCSYSSPSSYPYYYYCDDHSDDAGVRCPGNKIIIHNIKSHLIL